MPLLFNVKILNKESKDYERIQIKSFELFLLFSNLLLFMWQQLKQNIINGDIKALARCISLVENEVLGYEDFLCSLPSDNDGYLIGITGPPGAGKSTLTDTLIGELLKNNKKVAVLCIDPSSPFNLGSVLGDRIRMSKWYQNPNVYIRSLASRGALGGLHPKIIEITDIVKNARYDYIIIETVGVGQSEIEIAGLADTTIVVLVPESGDEIQTMKAGLMEIADIFVVNKADRPGADTFIANLRQMLAPVFHKQFEEVPIIKTIASQATGIEELADNILQQKKNEMLNEKKWFLLAEKAYNIIQKKKMEKVDKSILLKEIIEEGDSINLYSFIKKYL